MFASSWYQDTAGPLARTVADCALLMNTIAGYDPNDPMSADIGVPDYTDALTGDVRGMRVGVIREAMEAPHLDPEIRQITLDAVHVIESLGATIEEVSIPLMRDSGLINGALGAPRAALHWRHLNETPSDYDKGVRRYTLLPALIPAVIYQRALQLRSLLRAQILDATQQMDVLITPAYPDFPPRIEDTKEPPRSKEHAVQQMRRFSFATAANYAGLPAMSVPAGFSRSGLPIGLQLMGKRFDEESVLRLGHAFEIATVWHTMRPPFGAD
jgi:Asp-tRNA(Asn)/Glu-tRNA(Gln) amidotransferase A subunit family amidase